MRIIEALPLSVFLLYIKLLPPSTPHDWLIAYQSSTITALATLFVLLIYKKKSNFIFTGINLYLVSGYCALIYEFDMINKLYGEMQASAMLAWIAITGLLISLWHPERLIGHAAITQANTSTKAYWASAFLVASAAVAGIVSYYLRGNQIYSELLPFAGLFGAQYLLTCYANKY